MAITSIILDTRRLDSSGLAPIVLRLAHRGTTSYISTDIKIKPSQWDEKRGRIRNHPQQDLLNAHLLNELSKLDNFLAQKLYLGELAGLKASGVKKLYERASDPNAVTDQNNFLRKMREVSERKNIGTQKTFLHTIRKIEQYLEDNRLPEPRFEDIKPGWLEKFEKYLSTHGSKRNTCGIHMRNMRTVFNAAIDDELTTYYPFRRYKIRREVTAHRDLSVEELRRLIFFECEECAVKYRDYFVLMFLLMGINNKDLCHLKEMRRGRLQFNRAKTKTFYDIKVEPEAKALINKYRGKNWLIDVLDHWDNDEFFRKKMNGYLKKIGPVKRSGLGGKKTYEPLFPFLTVYYARHTWASIAASIDIPQETISACLGHQFGNPVTRVYIRPDVRKNDRANRSVIDWVFYGKINGEEVVAPGTPMFFGLGVRMAEKLGLVKVNPEQSDKTHL